MVLYDLSSDSQVLCLTCIAKKNISETLPAFVRDKYYFPSAFGPNISNMSLNYCL